MTRIVVTGASGLIGQPTIRSLRELIPGAEIHAASRGHQADRTVSWHDVDLLVDGPQLLADVRPDVLIHLAWETAHGEFWASPANADWVTASMSLVDAFASNGGKRAVIAGTCAEYAWDSGAPTLHEDSSPIDPASPYGKAKAQLHADARILLAGTGVSLAWGRIFFPYGPHEDARKLISSVAKNLLRGKPASINSGAAQRDFIFAADVGAAFASIAASELDGAINVGSGIPLSLREVGTLIGHATGAAELLTIDDGADSSAVVADVTRLTNDVGFVPATPMAVGIDMTVATLVTERD